MAGPTAGSGGYGHCAATRQSVKQRGRAIASNELRSRCLARIRQGREEWISRLRNHSDENGACSKDTLRSVARDLLMDEVMPENSAESRFEPGLEEEDWMSEEEMLRLEEEIYEELARQAEERAIEEAEAYIQAQNEEDCALYEQHLLGGVPCPLCDLGRLEKSGTGELRCCRCKEMTATLMDEAIEMDDIFEMLGSAEERHRSAGCTIPGCFKVCHEFGQPLLFYHCDTCGWHEVVF
eukprot:TRINITY_DN66471_c0_g1_i1.p1 TRINITY_DN66471_c0_g1~~TRINITY_DN66471_c0_g1_i1.p1  ORF type:complete len:250 (-),score=38.85 TRINITY_DN66471_c0_g1_i1:150-863(-)